MTATPRPIGPASLQSAWIAGGNESLMFEAVLLCDGAPVAIVSNSGTGGCHSYRPLDRDGRAVISALERYATERATGAPGPVPAERHDGLGPH